MAVEAFSDRPARAAPAGLIALSFAAFAIGTGEFVISGILPAISSDFAVSIPVAGLLVTGYAAAVAVGGPILALLTTNVARKPLIVFLLAFFTAGQLLCTLAPSYGWLMAARIFVACCHGVFFGAGSVAAIELAPAGRRGMAMALFLGGITVANVLGIPAGTAIGNSLGWRWSFVAVGICGLAASLAVGLALPSTPSGEERPQSSMAAQFRALNHHQVYLSYLVVGLVMVGALAFATYQVPALVEITRLPIDRVPVYLLLSGVGTIIGMYVGGRFADWKPMPAMMTVLIAQVGLGILMVAGMRQPIAMAFVMFLAGAITWALNAPVQARILGAAQAAPHLASALISTAYNIGIAAGALAGGLWIDAGLGYGTLPYLGSAGSLLASAVAALSWRLDRREAGATRR